VLVLAEIGFATSFLEAAATAVGYGAVMGGFVASGVGMVTGRARKDLEANALRAGFIGGFVGMLCLCADLIPSMLR
jgi:hypothetical protein